VNSACYRPMDSHAFDTSSSLRVAMSWAYGAIYSSSSERVSRGDVAPPAWRNGHENGRRSTGPRRCGVTNDGNQE
jgi:hypothetical protein